MNNNLEQLSEEVLKFMIESDHAQTGDVAALARIALAAKQAKPVVNAEFKDGWPVPNMMGVIKGSEKLSDGFHDLYTTPQPANTEQDGWVEFVSNIADDTHQNNSLREWAKKLLAAAPKPESE